ncbi:MAG: thioredoxin family protein [Gemmatimonadetes bacterium]|nr:thioredoxin family protein [Gemmatimonadota bacterium]
MGDFDYRKYWEIAFSWDDYLTNEVKEHRSLWEGVWSRATMPEWASRAAAAAGGEWKLLVISEDWCGDASNTVPVIARLAEALPNVEMRVIKRDEHPELMDRHLTNGSRSIPLAIVLRPDWSVAGQWGPRPSELQAFVLREKKAALRPTGEIYRDVRQWYARDRGDTTIREILAIFEHANPQRAAA